MCHIAAIEADKNKKFLSLIMHCVVLNFFIIFSSIHTYLIIGNRFSCASTHGGGYGCSEEHHACKVGLGETGDTAPTGRGRPQGGGNVLQGGGSSDTPVWVGDVGPFCSNGE